MMKKIINLLVVSLPLWVQAQITLSAQLPPAGMIQKDQLWNLVLVNNGTAAQEVFLFLDLKDALTGQSVLSAGTRSILLGKGAKLLSARDVQPVQYHYGAGGPNGSFLPLGSYIACYIVTKGSEKPETLANECIRININPLSPPLLNSPVHQAVLPTTYPQLSWIPPAPLEMFDDLSYDLNITEVLEGQSSAEAVLYNPPVYVKGQIKVPYTSYPSTYSGLQAGKTYAWQVTARNGLAPAATTEVWTFRIGGDSVKTQPESVTYILMKNNTAASGVRYISGNTLRVKYYSFDKEHEAIIRFVTAGGKAVQKVKQTIVYGDNFFSFPLSKRFHPGQVYLLEVTDLQKNKHSISFSLK